MEKSGKAKGRFLGLEKSDTGFFGLIVEKLTKVNFLQKTQKFMQQNDGERRI